MDCQAYYYTKNDTPIISELEQKEIVEWLNSNYLRLIKNGENGILIPTKDNNKGWHKAIKKLILDKEYLCLQEGILF